MRVLAVGLVLGLGLGAAPDVSREQAAAFQKKLSRIVQHADAGAQGRTPVTEGEVNSYLRFSAGDQIPVGVTEPVIVIEGNDRLSGRAVVDLDAIRRQRGRGGWFDPTTYLRGLLPITARGLLRTERGRGTFVLEQAAVSGVPIPKAFLQEIVSYYTRTSSTPAGIDLDAPFELPAAIERIEVAAGHAVIVQ